MSDGKIHCRSKASKNCYDGKSAIAVYGPDGMAEDGTFDGTTVCCDACYMAIGQPSIDVADPRARQFTESLGQPPEQPPVHTCSDGVERAEAGYDYPAQNGWYLSESLGEATGGDPAPRQNLGVIWPESSGKRIVLADQPKRYSWTQPQCVECWKLQNGERQPVLLKSPEQEQCVTCGKSTQAGLYIRIDPAKAPYPSIGKDE